MADGASELISEIMDERSECSDELLVLSGKIKEWLNGDKQKGDEKINKQQLLLPVTVRNNAFKNYALIKTLRNDFPGTFIRSVNGHLLVSKFSSPTEGSVVKEMYEQDDEEAVAYLVGFSRVFKEIVEAKKPLVGHNLMLDLLHLYQHFYQPLPCE